MKRCFTLLELIVVVAILALVITLAGTRMGSGSTRLRLKTEADEGASFLSSARAMSMHQQRRVPVVLEGQALFIEELPDSRGERRKRVHKFGRGVEIASQASKEDGQLKAFTFFPDGRGSGAPLRLSMKAHAFELAVSPLSGAVLVKEVEE